jgi:H+/Cl- antiporter ClcA
MTDTAPPKPTAAQAAATLRSRQFLVLLVVVSVIGVIVSLAAWCFLELIHQMQQELYTHLPHAVGYDNGPPVWWPLPILAVAGLVVALAITKLPGDGGHLPARGLAAGGQPNPINVPGVVLAGLATVGSGLVLGPEAPLIALGSGVAVMMVSRRKMPLPALQIVAASGAFAAVSFIFSSPLMAAILVIELAGLGGPQMPLVLIPGLLAAGIGSLVSIGMGSFTGLSTSAYALAPVALPHFGHPDIAQFGWTIALAVAVAIGARLIMSGGLATYSVVVRRLLLALPLVALVIGGLAIAFSQATDKSFDNVLFSGQDSLPGLISNAGTWSIGALALLLVFKGLAWSLSLGSFRGGPTFPALFLGAAAGVMASHLPGFSLVPAVAVGMGAGLAAVLKLPLSAVVIATLLTSRAGTGDEPLIIVGVVAAYLVAVVMTSRQPAKQADTQPAPAAPTPVVASPEPATAAHR